jgi:hypothetical protein
LEAVQLKQDALYRRAKSALAAAPLKGEIAARSAIWWQHKHRSSEGGKQGNANRERKLPPSSTLFEEYRRKLDAGNTPYQAKAQMERHYGCSRQWLNAKLRAGAPKES